MANLRSVNTKFWEDPWVESLNISDKLLFLYLITNGYANLAGIYEITIRRISFETGLNQETIRKGLKGFEMVKKAYFVNDNYVFLPNWLKNQNLNGNMKKGVVTIINQLPKEVKISILGNHYQTIQKDYQTILNTLLKYEVEVLEEEKEVEVEREWEKQDIDLFFEGFKKITGKNIRVIDDKTKKQFKARIKDGYTVDEILNAVENCKVDKYHVENPQYLTLEFITRSDKLQKYANVVSIVTQGKVKLSKDAYFALSSELIKRVESGEITEMQAFELM